MKNLGLKVKNKLFDLLARNISLESFEQWLYTDIDVLNNVDSDEFILELINRDFKDKHILQDLEKLCFDTYNKEEYLVYAVESVCKKIKEDRVCETMVESALFLDKYYNWDDDYQIIYAFYGIACNFDLVEIGCYSRGQIIAELKVLSIEILDKFRGTNLNQKIDILKTGL
jgi:hypothetical protein